MREGQAPRLSGALNRWLRVRLKGEELEVPAKKCEAAEEKKSAK